MFSVNQVCGNVIITVATDGVLCASRPMHSYDGCLPRIVAVRQFLLALLGRCHRLREVFADDFGHLTVGLLLSIGARWVIAVESRTLGELVRGCGVLLGSALKCVVVQLVGEHLCVRLLHAGVGESFGPGVRLGIRSHMRNRVNCCGGLGDVLVHGERLFIEAELRLGHRGLPVLGDLVGGSPPLLLALAKRSLGW